MALPCKGRGVCLSVHHRALLPDRISSLEGDKGAVDFFKLPAPL